MSRITRSTLLLAALALSTTALSTTALADPPAVERLVGQTEPAARIEVPAVTRGRIAEINVKEGQPIKKGDIIAQLDSGIQTKTVKLAELKAKSVTDINWARKASLFAQNELDKYKSSPAVSPADLAGKQIAFDQAEAYVKKAVEAQLIEEITWEREKIILDQMTIKSPLDGYIHRLPKQAGEAIDENQPVAVVVQTSKVTASFFLNEALFGKVKAGDKAQIEMATTPPLAREATIVAVDPFVDPAGHLFRVKMELDNADNKIPVGIAATWKMPK
jgi:RND family efflux transporter MFP subunit